MAANLSFKEQYSLEERRAHFNLTRQRYPDMIPVILENAENSQYHDMARKKHFVPYNASVGNFSDRIRCLLNLNHGQPFFLFATNNNKLLRPDALMSAVYDLNKDEDGALYIEYSDRFFIHPEL